MVNLFLEIERLKASLRSKGLDEETIDAIAFKAEKEINLALQEQMSNAMESAIQAGVQKDSAEFINDLRPRYDAFELDTMSGMTDFTEPPFPMLDKLLASGAKPMNDGSGVYKVIPVGGQSKAPKKAIHTNIFDAQRAIAAERYETALNQYNKVVPKGSKVNFRTATSKQDRNTQWVQPEKEKDFTQDLIEINSELKRSGESVIMDIIRSYEEGF